MPSVRRIEIADGDAGTEQTVDAMAGLIRDGALTPAVRRAATAIVSDITDPVRQLLALRSWVNSHFQFVRDPASGELLHEPSYLLGQIRTQGRAVGDCDDAAILSGALACAVGFRVALIVVAVSDGQAEPMGELPYSHVWASMAAPSGPPRWMQFDITRPAQYDPTAYIRRARAFPIC